MAATARRKKRVGTRWCQIFPGAHRVFVISTWLLGCGGWLGGRVSIFL